MIIGEHGEQRVETVDAAVVPNQIVSAIRSGHPGESVTEVAKLGHAECGRRIGNGRLRAVHFAKIAFGDDLLAFVLPVAELEDQIARHVVNAGIDGAGGADRVNVVVGNLGDDFFLQFVRERMVIGLFDFGDR